MFHVKCLNYWQFNTDNNLKFVPEYCSKPPSLNGIPVKMCESSVHLSAQVNLSERPRVSHVARDFNGLNKGHVAIKCESKVVEQTKKSGEMRSYTS